MAYKAPDNSENIYLFQNIILSLAGMELTFFIGSHMVLCFGFVTETHQCFGCC